MAREAPRPFTASFFLPSFFFCAFRTKRKSEYKVIASIMGGETPPLRGYANKKDTLGCPLTIVLSLFFTESFSFAVGASENSFVPKMNTHRKLMPFRLELGFAFGANDVNEYLRDKWQLLVEYPCLSKQARIVCRFFFWR